MKNFLAILMVFFVSCNTQENTYNVKLKNASIVEATNTLNTYSYKKGDTVCIFYSSYLERWEFDENMKDTTFYTSSYKYWSNSKKDSVLIPRTTYKYRIGVIQ